MPLDHYVSQVHLKNFCSPALGGKKLHGCRKRDGLVFPCSPKDVCRIEEGSTNKYLIHDRAIEDFLKTVEPRYNEALTDLKNGSPSQESVYTIAGFVAYVVSCSPTAMRLGEHLLRNAMETGVQVLDQQGLLPAAPKGFGNKSMSESVADGSIVLKVDEKYPQAIGINQIMTRTGMFGNAAWDLIHNEDKSSPFFTNDFASAIEQSPEDNRVINRLVPLSPDFAIRIRPDLESKKFGSDHSFPRFRFRTIRPNRKSIQNFNQAIVRCAEELVFYRDELDWIAPYIDRNRDYWIEPYTARIPTSKGYLNVTTTRIGKRSFV